MQNFSSAVMALVMIAGFLLLIGGIKLAARSSDPDQRRSHDRRRVGDGHERDDLDGIAGFTGSVASRMSR